MQERFWAKTGSGKFEDDSPQYHPVICHLADTAAVAMAIVREYLSPTVVATFKKGLGLQNEEALIKCCGFLAGSHDLGKISPAFQFQVSEVGKALAGESLYDLWSSLPREIQSEKAPHGTVTAATLPEFLLEIGLGQDLSEKFARRLAKRLAVLVGGHHGFFPSTPEIEEIENTLAVMDEQNDWKPFNQSIFKQLQEFVELSSEDLPSQCDNAAAMLLAGLTTVSDWIASNADEASGFQYANDMPFAEYADGLWEKARRALVAIGWKKVSTGQPLGFQELFPEIKNPRPLQEAAVDLTKNLSSSCLILVEASMGEGKTEAALYLADYLQHQTSAGGFYLGLPTQATSNAMWKRVQTFLQKRYPDISNLTLSHSAAALKTEYLESVCRLDQVYDKDKRVFASEWHTARKRSLLSPYGVGTIDQGLMGVVQSRHQFVRLFGLAGRTVILDEIHAYDLYTSTLLERLLEWLALLGSPVIALSATLPTDTRRKLINAYAKGCGASEPELPQAEYPRITALTQAGVQVKSFAASDHVKRSLNLHWVNDAEWTAALQSELVDGGCAAVICSTVGRAQKVFQRLQEHFPDYELGLFHGRFLFVDRERIERDCQSMFGKDSIKFIVLLTCVMALENASQDLLNLRVFIAYLLYVSRRTRPYRYVLIATQVIEQSLDVDFDLMISDLAPVDLLLQRSGRLHRHDRDRPTKLEQPTFWPIAPSLSKIGNPEFGESRWIYDRHVLLRSWLTLRGRSCIKLPEETDGLIESVYDLDAEIPDSLELSHSEDWQASLSEYKKDREVRKTLAKGVQVPPARADNQPEHFTRKGEEDDESAIAAMTRLGEASVTTIFMQQTEKGLVLPFSRAPVNLKNPLNLAEIRELLNHSTRISKKDLVGALLAQPKPANWTSALLRSCRYVELDPQSITQVGNWKLSLDPQLGVVIDSA